MKRTWVLTLILVVAGSVARVQSANEPSLKETSQLAASLDELVDQKPVGDQVVRNGKRMKVKVAPVQLKLLTPVASKMLEVDESKLSGMLQENRELLSRIVYARLLAKKTARTWDDVLRTESGRDMLADLQDAHVPLTEIYELLDNLYTELSFAALDSPLEEPKPAKKRKHS